jgi:predicted kinase
MKPKAYILVGVPGSGKSTWSRSQEWVNQCEYVSSDAFIDAHAHDVGKTYNEVFAEFIGPATELMTKQVIEAVKVKRDIIWDQTNTTVNSRRKKFIMLPGYYMIAVLFRTPEPDELDKRLSSRIGKQIPKEVMDKMISGLEEPSEQEGFDEVWYAA